MTTTPYELLLRATQEVADGRNGRCMATMEELATHHTADLWSGLYQDDVCWINNQLPEFNVDWPMVMPGTLLIERNGNPDELCVLVLWSDAPATDLVKILHPDGFSSEDIHLEESDLEVAYQ